MQEKLRSKVNVAVRFRPMMPSEEQSANWKINPVRQSNDQSYELKLLESKN